MSGPSPSETRQNRWDAELYDGRHAFVWQHGASLLEWLAPRAGERILDLGCGTGHLSARISESGAEVVGIDSSAAMIEQARRDYPALRFEVADARAFACDEPFDAVFSNAVLHWIKEPAEVAARVRSALRPGGRFAAELGGRGNVRAIVAALQDAARAEGLGPWDDPWYFPGIPEYAAVLEAADLEVVQATLFDRPTPLEGESGLRHWVEMFANDLLAKLPTDRRDGFLDGLERSLRPALHRDGTWFADYRRLRVLAHAREDLGR